MRHWLVKQEPTTYAWERFVADGATRWDGVRNFQARSNLAAMKQGDLVLYYHSSVGKEVVGIARVKREGYPDPTASEGDWVAVDLEPQRALAKPVALATIKNDEALKDIALVRQPRLSVVPISAEEFARILALAV